jgi:arylsulfatase A-like enzyme
MLPFLTPFLRRSFVALVCFAWFDSSLLGEELPNVIIINIDDMGYADIGPFGSTLNRTPHLDRMAAEGMKLKCHYAAPVCSPSRSSLMTGCYPKRVLPISHVLFPAGEVGLHPEEVTIADLLKTKGYATACIGKWHLGDQPEFLPTRQGFDFYYGIPYSNDMGTAAEGSKSDLGAPLPKPANGDNGAKAGKAVASAPDELGLRGNAQPPLPLLRNQTVIERVNAEGQQTLTARYTEEAVRFIQTHREKPFFLYLPHTAIHFPLYPGKAFYKQSKNGLVGDWIEEVDWSVGQVLETVRSAKLEGKTLVFFTSDNGGTSRSVNTPLRGNKGSTWEGGMRVPTIAWWPGKIPSGSVTEEITSMMDLLPTIARLAQAELPSRKLDGGDLWPILAGQPKAVSPHRVFYYYRGLKLEAVREGSMKLHLAAPTSDGKSGKGPAAKASLQLYDLSKDIGESRDLAASQPDTVHRLMELARKMEGDLGMDGIGPGCRPLGKVQDPRPLIDSDGNIRSEFR